MNTDARTKVHAHNKYIYIYMNECVHDKLYTHADENIYIQHEHVYALYRACFEKKSVLKKRLVCWRKHMHTYTHIHTKKFTHTYTYIYM